MVRLNKNKEVVAVMFLTMLAILITTQSVCFPLSQHINYSDGSIYQYIGHLMLQGKMPYKDAFDHKGPFLYMVNAVASMLDIKHGIWFIDAAFMTAFWIFAYKVCRRFVGVIVSFAITSTVMTQTVYSYWIGNTPDFYAAALSMVVLYFLLDYYLFGDIKTIKILIGGVLTSICFWMKPNTIAMIGVICLCILIECIWTKQFARIFKFIIIFIVGFMIPTIISIIWVVSHNSLEMMINDYFLFNMFYAGNDASFLGRVQTALFFLRQPLILAGISACGVYGLETFSGKNTERTKVLNKLMVVSCITFVASLYVCISPGRSYQQYAMSMLPLTILLCGLTFKRVGFRKDSHIYTDIAIIAMVLHLFLPAMNRLPENQIDNLSPDYVQNQIVNEIDLRTDGNDKIAIASPDHCGMYIWSDRESATTSPYIQAIMYDGRHKGFWQDYMAQIQVSNTKAIVWNNKWNINDYIGEILVGYELRLDTGNLSLYISK